MNYHIKKHHKFTIENKYYFFVADELKAYTINKTLYDDLSLNRVDFSDKGFVKDRNTIYQIDKGENSELNTGEGSDQIDYIYSVSLNVAQICNMKCIYCYGDGGEYGNKTVMDFDTAKRSVDFIIENSGVKNKIFICFFGGEPLLNFALIKEIVKYSKMAGEKNGKRIYFSITTNGTLLNDNINSFLYSNNMSVTISFDGDKQSQDANRPLKIPKSSYDYVSPRIIRFLSTKENKAIARVTITEKSSGISAIRSSLKNIGFKRIEFVPASVDPSGNLGITEAHFQDLIENIKYEAHALIEKIKSREDIYSSNFTEIIARLIRRQRKDFYCGAGRTYAAVSADGLIFPCHRFVGNPQMLIGKISDKNFQKNNQLRISKIDGNKNCKKCWAKYLCGGGCYYDNYETCGDVIKPNKMQCRILRKKIEYAVFVVDSLSKEDRKYLMNNS